MPRNQILNHPEGTWDAVLARERLWSASGYRALARIKDRNPARLEWVIDAMEAGVGTSFAAALRDARMHPGAVSAMFLTAAIDQGVLQLKPDVTAPTEAHDRGMTAIGREHHFNFHQLLAGFAPGAIDPTDWQLLREYLERMQLGDLAHPVPLRPLLKRLHIDLDRCVYPARPVRARDHTELAYVGNVQFDKHPGDLVVAECGMLFVPAHFHHQALSRVQQRVYHDGLAALAEGVGSRWVAWDAITDYQSSYPPGMVKQLFAQWRESQELPQRKYVVTTADGDHQLAWTARTMASDLAPDLVSRGIRWGYVLR